MCHLSFAITQLEAAFLRHTVLVPKLVAMAISLSTSGPPSNMIPTAHLSPQPKQHLDRFSRFCTADCRVSLWHTCIKTKNDLYSGKLQTTSLCCHNLTNCLPLWAWLSKVKWLSLEYTYQLHLHTDVVIIVQCHTTWHYSTVRRGLGGSPFTHTFLWLRQCNRPPSRATVPTTV